MSGRGCLSADELVAAIHHELPDEAAEHLGSCRICTQRARLLERAALVEVTPIDEVMEEVDSLVARLLVASRDEWRRIAGHPQYRRAEVVIRLMTVADDASRRNKKEAVALIRVATRIVNRLPPDLAGVDDLRFETWKLASALLREAGEYAYVELALEEAERAARTASDPELAEASVLFSRALLYAEPDVWQPEEAASLLDRAEQVFANRGDTERRRAVLTTRAFLLYRSGDCRAARTAFAEIVSITPPQPRPNYLIALTNLTAARLACSEADVQVEESLEILMKEYEARGLRVHLARARWLMGDLRRLRGEYDRAVDLYRSARSDVGDADSSIRAGLRLLETLILAGRHAEALPLAHALAAETVTLDRREPSRRRSHIAAVLAYAREAAHGS